MDMPERSFGRMVRYRRTQLGLSQAELAELVGRSTSTIRSWERDKSRPNDAKVLAALVAILGVDERHFFDKAGIDPPPQVETSPTVEQALATLSFPEDVVSDGDEPGEETVDGEAPQPELEGDRKPEQEPVLVSAQLDERRGEESPGDRVDESDGELVGSGDTPAYVAPPDPYQRGPLTPTLADVSYMEDNSQRQLYRVRNLATIVALIALVIAFIWALGEGLGALGEWWDEFFGNLRL